MDTNGQKKPPGGEGRKEKQRSFPSLSLEEGGAHLPLRKKKKEKVKNFS